MNLKRKLSHQLICSLNDILNVEVKHGHFLPSEYLFKTISNSLNRFILNKYFDQYDQCLNLNFLYPPPRGVRVKKFELKFCLKFSYLIFMKSQKARLH